MSFLNNKMSSLGKSGNTNKRIIVNSHPLTSKAPMANQFNQPKAPVKIGVSLSPMIKRVSQYKKTEELEEENLEHQDLVANNLENLSNADDSINDITRPSSPNSQAKTSRSATTPTTPVQHSSIVEVDDENVHDDKEPASKDSVAYYQSDQYYSEAEEEEVDENLVIDLDETLVIDAEKTKNAINSALDKSSLEELKNNVIDQLIEAKLRGALSDEKANNVLNYLLTHCKLPTILSSNPKKTAEEYAEYLLGLIAPFSDLPHLWLERVTYYPKEHAVSLANDWLKLAKNANISLTPAMKESLYAIFREAHLTQINIDEKQDSNPAVADELKPILQARLPSNPENLVAIDDDSKEILDEEQDSNYAVANELKPILQACLPSNPENLVAQYFKDVAPVLKNFYEIDNDSSVSELKEFLTPYCAIINAQKIANNNYNTLNIELIDPETLIDELTKNVFKQKLALKDSQHSTNTVALLGILAVAAVGVALIAITAGAFTVPVLAPAAATIIATLAAKVGISIAGAKVITCTAVALASASTMLGVKLIANKVNNNEAEKTVANVIKENCKEVLSLGNNQTNIIAEQYQNFITPNQKVR